MIKQVTATNARGDTFTFSRLIRLVNGIDLSGLTATVNTSEGTDDGSVYQNTKLDNRDFDLSFQIRKTSENAAVLKAQKKLLYTVFNPSLNPIRFTLVDDLEDEYYLDARLLGAPAIPPDKKNDNAAHQKGFLQFMCNDPFIYAKNAVNVDVAAWVGAFEFPLEIALPDGIEMGYRTESLIANVLNNGQVETGMVIRFRALATVVNPSLINVYTYERFKLNVTMQGGDLIEVSTHKGDKSIELVRNNVRSNIFSRRVLGTKFLQLGVGDNLFRYDADDGLDNLEIQIQYRPKFTGL